MKSVIPHVQVRNRHVRGNVAAVARGVPPQLGRMGDQLLPEWCMEESSAALLNDFLELANVPDQRRLRYEDLAHVYDRMELASLGGENRGYTRPTRFAVPTARSRVAWKDCCYRLTIGWAAAAAAAAEPALELERLEVAGPAMAGPRTAAFAYQVQLSLTLFLGPGRGDISSCLDSVRDSRLDANLVSISGADIIAGAPGRGFGRRYSAGDLAELSRRSGMRGTPSMKRWAQ